jgi:hypothetical protein
LTLPAAMPTDEPPRQPDDQNGRFRLMSFGFWAALGFVLICVAAAVFVALAVPKLWPKAPPKPAAVAAAPHEDAETAALKARISELEHELDQARQAAASPAGSGQPPAPALAQRLDRIEQAERRTAQAAAAAVAAGALADAAETSRPFSAELAALERLDPDADLLSGLRPLAATGAPTRAALITGFSDAALRASTALHAPPKGASPLARVMSALSRLVSIRRIDDVTGQTPDAALARAERALSDGDLKAALTEVDSLPQPGRDAIAEWRTGAGRRLEIERRIEALRARALRDLAADPGLSP